MRVFSTSSMLSFLTLVFLLQSCLNGGTGEMPDEDLALGIEFEKEILPVDTLGEIRLSAGHQTSYYITGGADNSDYLFVEVSAGARQTEFDQVVGTNGHVNITIPEGVELETAYGGEYFRKGSDIVFGIGELKLGTVYRLLLKFSRNEQSTEDLSFATHLVYTDLLEEELTQQLVVNTVLQPTLDQTLLASTNSTIVDRWISFYRANMWFREIMGDALANWQEDANTKAELEELKAFLDGEISTKGTSYHLAKQVQLVESFQDWLNTDEYMGNVVGEKAYQEIWEKNKNLALNL